MSAAASTDSAHDTHDEHGHGHGPDNSGPVIAVAVIVLGLVAAFAVGNSMPRMQYTPQAGSQVRAPLHGSAEGLVVLEDGTVLEGLVAEREGALAVETDEGLIYFPKSQVRVFVPRSSAQYYATREAAAEAPAAPEEDAEEEEAAAAPGQDTGRIRQLAALAWQARERRDWLEAARQFGHLYEASGSAEDLDQALACSRSAYDAVRARDGDPVRVVAEVATLLRPFASEQRVKATLADLYHATAAWCMTVDQDSMAHRYATRLGALGGEWEADAALLREELLRRGATRRQ